MSYGLFVFAMYFAVLPPLARLMVIRRWAYVCTLLLLTAAAIGCAALHVDDATVKVVTWSVFIVCMLTFQLAT